jgi:hypothetical protein
MLAIPLPWTARVIVIRNSVEHLHEVHEMKNKMSKLNFRTYSKSFASTISTVYGTLMKGCGLTPSTFIHVCEFWLFLVYPKKKKPYLIGQN